MKAGEGDFRLELAPPALRNLDRIPPRYASAIVEFMTGVLLTNPRRLGKPLKDELEELHGARRGDYRLIYRILEDDRVVLVMRIDHPSSAYKGR